MFKRLVLIVGLGIFASQEVVPAAPGRLKVFIANVAANVCDVCSCGFRQCETCTQNTQVPANPQGDEPASCRCVAECCLFCSNMLCVYCLYHHELLPENFLAAATGGLLVWHTAYSEGVVIRCAQCAESRTRSCKEACVSYASRLRALGPKSSENME